jgi:O-antigen/teichoic acid export membrane protein
MLTGTHRRAALPEGREDVAESDPDNLKRDASPADAAVSVGSSAAADPPPFDRTALTRSAGRGGLWQVAGLGWQTLVQYGALVVMTRVLKMEPRDYGMFGMALLVQTLITRIGVLGTTSGVVAKQDATEDDLSSAFWLGAAVQVGLFFIAFAAAPLATLYFRPGEGSGYTDVAQFRRELTWVLRAVAATFLFTAVGAISNALITKRLQFGAQKVIEGGAFAVQMASAIVLAWLVWRNHWALVASMLIGSFVGMVATVAYARWRPRLRVRKDSLRYMVRFGIHGLGSSLTDFFHHNVDYMVVGRLLGEVEYGVYSLAFTIPHMVIDRLAVPVGAVVFPTFAKIQADDETLIDAYIKVTKYLALVVFPLMGGMAAVAEPAVLAMMGEKWLGVVGPLQVLCLRVAAACLCTCVGYVFLCRNRPDLVFKFGLITAIFTIVVVAAMGWLFGLYGVAWGMVISLLPNMLGIRKAFQMTHAPVRKLLARLVPPAVTAVASSAAAYAMCWWLGQMEGLRQMEAGELLRLVASVATGVGVYLAVMRVLFADSIRDVRETVRVVFRKSARSPAA